MCHCLYQVLSKRFPNLLQNNIGAVGTVIFLRFINPAIGKFTKKIYTFSKFTDLCLIYSLPPGTGHCWQTSTQFGKAWPDVNVKNFAEHS